MRRFDMSHPEIISNIDQLMSIDIIPQEIMSDTTIFNTYNSKQDGPYVDTELDGDYLEVYNKLNEVFNLLTASPSNADLFRKYYTFPRDIGEWKDLESHKKVIGHYDDEIPLNLSENFMKNRLLEIIDISTKAKDKKGDRRGNVIFLVGGIGSGKTMAVNYMCSYFYELLDDKHVMWINLRFTKEEYRYMVAEKDLNYALCNRIAWVALHKYKGRLGFDSGKYMKYVKRKMGNANDVRLVVNDFIKSDPVYEGPYHDYVIRTIKDFVIESGYSLVFAIDGIDEHDGHDENYDIIVNKVASEIYKDEIKGCVLLTLREKSLYDVTDKVQQMLHYSDKTFRRPVQEFFLLQPKMYEIYSKRVRCIDITNKSDKNIISRQNVFVMIRVFYLFVYKGLVQSNKIDKVVSYSDKKLFTAIKDVMGSNYRQISECLLSILFVFLAVLKKEDILANDLQEIKIQDLKMSSDPFGQLFSLQFTNYNITPPLRKILKKSYLVMEVLTCGRKRCYKHPYFYKYNKNVPILGKNKKQNYLYSIYKVAAYGEKKQDIQILRKIRILQALNNIQKASHDKPVSMREDEISSLLRPFNYNNEKTLIDIKELCLLGYINIDYRRSTGNPYCCYYITRQGEQILKTFVFDLNYLFYSLGDIIIDVKLSKLFFLNARRPKRKLAEWLARGIFNVVMFCKLIQLVESKEIEAIKIQSIKEEIISRYGISKEICFKVQELYKHIFSNLKDKTLLQEVTTIFGSYVEDDYRFVKQRIS